MRTRARSRKGRPTHGILLLDKPSGMTSNAALQKVKRLYQAHKAGHTGSLDPLASGLLPICLGHATKLSAFLLNADKTYEVRCRFGQATDTGDADGSLVEACQTYPSLAQIQQKMTKFVGPQTQIPPMYSALKKDGKRLYQLAREGKTVERKAREITIHALTFGAYDGMDLEFKVNCSKGTYVRTLVEDFAQSLGSLAHVTSLRRITTGPFTQEQMVSLEQVKQSVEAMHSVAAETLLWPLEAAVPNMPVVEVNSEMGFYLMNGQALQVSGAPANGVVRLDIEGRGMVGIGEILSDGRVAPRRLFYDKATSK